MFINRVVRYLGCGQFGNVEEGVWTNDNTKTRVALKKLNEDASPLDRVKFLQEAAIMTQFDHSNVIKLLGIVHKNNDVGPIQLFILFHMSIDFTLTFYLIIDFASSRIGQSW